MAAAVLDLVSNDVQSRWYAGSSGGAGRSQRDNRRSRKEQQSYSDKGKEPKASASLHVSLLPIQP